MYFPDHFYPSAIRGWWSIVTASGICLSVCLSIQFLLAYIHYWHQTITAYLPWPILVPRCYYFGSLTFDLSMVTLTLILFVTTKLPEPNITSIPKRYICCVLQISRTRLMTSYKNIIEIKHHMHAKMVHLVNLANILYKFYGEWTWLTFDILFKVR